MTIGADELADLFGIDIDDSETETAVPLGTALSGRFSDTEIDSVEAVRELRERER